MTRLYLDNGIFKTKPPKFGYAIKSTNVLGRCKECAYWKRKSSINPAFIHVTGKWCSICRTPFTTEDLQIAEKNK